MSNVLVVDDEPAICWGFRELLRGEGHEVTIASSAEEALQVAPTCRPDTILLDVRLPGMDGLSALKQLRATSDDAPVVVMTAFGSLQTAVRAVEEGAFDYLTKPFELADASDVVRRALAHRSGRVPSVQKATDAVDGEADPAVAEAMIGSSTVMQAVFRQIAFVAQSDAPVLITGESGTGKEICAQAIHATSTRARGPFVPLNCGAIPPDLLESEVFGHLKGSFTGAIADSVGAAGAADGGTLFLDEICEMDLNLQTKLLRFLQTSTVQPVGAIKARKVNVRIICATNRDPYEEVKSGRFREDLYYRLHVVPIHLPPLRERAEDAVEIAEKMLLKFAVEEGRKFTRIDPDVKDLFRRLPWPGNVRQVLNLLRNVVVLNDAETVTTTMLPLEILHLNEEVVQTVASKNRPKDPPVGLEPLIGRPLAEIERLVIEETLRLHNGSVSQASRVLDISPSTLYRKLEGWNRGQ